MRKTIQSVVMRVLLFTLFVLFTACGGGGGGGGGSTDNNNNNGGGSGSAGVTVSGTISAADGTVTDSDTNDPHAVAADNNSPVTAQIIPNPAMVGGFVTANPTGVVGDHFENTADVVDVFAATLLAGQTATLTISDHPAGITASPDLDLYLYSQSDTTSPLVSSENQTATESVTIPANGNYYLIVHAMAGKSNYVLNIGKSPSSAAANAEPEFVPGEAVVRFADTSLPAGITDAVSYRAAQIGLQAESGGSGRSMLFSMPDALPQRAQALAALGVKSMADQTEFGFGTGETRLKHDTWMAVKALRARKDVKSADLNYIFQPQLVPNDPYYVYQWHYPLINLPQAWDLETGTSNGVTVAVVDTGVLLSHPDLTGVLISGYDFISDPVRANDGDGIDPNPNDPGDAQTPGGSSFHGTHVAGTIAANTNNNLGVAGISWGASIMPVRVLGVGGGTSYDIMQGVSYAAGLPNDSGTTPAKRADIINLSLSCSSGCFSQTEQDVYTAARDQGVIIIAAAGNENTSQLSYPASYDGVVSVSAVGPDKNRAPYSNYGSEIDVAAPGGDMSVDINGDGYPDGVLSTLANDSSGTPQPTYDFYNGTSMAAAHMTGVVALMKSANPTAVTPSQLDAWLGAGSITDDVAGNGASVRDNTYGYGLINAQLAVQQALGGTAPISLNVMPSSLSFGTTTTSLTMTLSTIGTGTLAVDNVSSGADWLSVNPTSGLGDYTVSIDRSGQAAGTYSTTITIQYTADGTAKSLGVPVNMEVNGSSSNTGDTGFTWILLLDPNTGNTVQVKSATNQGGHYTYQFSGVPDGSYYLIGGTDSDNDGYLCDPGEACGGYPTYGHLSTVVVSGQDVSGINFVNTYSSQPAAAAAGAIMPGPKGFSRFSTSKQLMKE